MNKNQIGVTLLLTALLVSVSCNLTDRSSRCDEGCVKEEAAKSAVQSFEKERSDWELLMAAYAGETNQLGRFSHIGYLPNPSSEYWRVFEKESELGKQYLESKVKILDCEAGQILENSYSIQDKKFSSSAPTTLECLQLFLKYGRKKE